jgi:hypothetical protein
MSTSIDQAFITQFESEVHVAFQRMGSKLQGMVRSKSSVNGSTVRFQKVGTGSASTKSRHGNVTPMNVDHSYVEATMEDWYAADYCDDLDEIKVNIQERQILAQAGASALGRKADDLILTQLDATTNTDTEAGTDTLATSSHAKVLAVARYFGEQDVPEDGQRFWAISPDAWNTLLSITAFASADYVGPGELPYKGGMMARQWLGFTWFVHSGLSKSGNIRKTFAWHKSAVGLGTGQEVNTRIDYVPEKASNLVNSKMSMGAKLIDAIGIYEVQVYEA